MNGFSPEPLVWQGGRVFVSPALGCPASCAFCYLGSFEGQVPSTITLSGNQLWAKLNQSPQFDEGVGGTLISLGCLSETLAPHAIEQTIQFLEAAIGTENQLQISTRWALTGQTASRFASACQQLQATIFHSLTCITGRNAIEKGTPSLDRRIQFIEILKSQKIKQVLYVKPMIPGITLTDAPAIADLAVASGIDKVVLGPLYADLRIWGNLALVGATTSDGFLLEQMPLAGAPTLKALHSDEETKIREIFLSRKLHIFRHGSEVAKLNSPTPPPK